MNDRERISRLVGAAISECSSSRLGGVRSLLVKAMERLGDSAGERKTVKEAPRPQVSFAGMTRRERDRALDAIEGMIEGERSKASPAEPGVDLFG